MKPRFPFVRIAILFTIGIILQKFIELPYWFFVPVVILLFLFSLKIYLKNKQSSSAINIPKRFADAILISILIIMTGYLSAKNNFDNTSYYPEWFYKQNDMIVWGKVESVSLENKKGFTFILSADKSQVNNQELHKKAEIIINIKRENLGEYFFTFYSAVSPGDYLKIKGLYIKGREERNPGEFDYNAFLRNKGISGVITVFNFADITFLKNEKDGFEEIIFDLRKNITRQINLLHEKETASLLKGLVIADRSDIDEDTQEEFINSGVIHVLAVSGLHVAFIIVIFILLFGRFNIWLRAGLIIAGIIFYILLTGAPASVVRAGIMSVIILAAFLSSRETNLFNTICVSAIIILAISPSQLWDAGFQLSYAAVLSIALIYPVLSKSDFIKKIENKFLRWGLYTLLLTLSAQIGTMPFIMMYFGKISLTSLAANLLVIPLSGILLGNGIFTIILSYISMPLSVYPALTSELMVKAMLLITQTFGGEGSFIPVFRFEVNNFLMYYLILGIFIYSFPRFNSVKARIVLSVLVLMNIILISFISRNDFKSPGELSIAALDVGQGDAFLISFPDGSTGLIDAGQATRSFDNGERIVLPVMNYYDIPKIDYAFISHMDKDHFSGMISLLHKGLIRKIFKPAPEPNDSISIRFDNFCKKKNILVQYFTKKKLSIGNTEVYLLNDKQFNTSNENSLLLKLVYGNTSFLFTGDNSKKSERYYSKYGAFLRSTVLKVSHHGSKTGTSDDFLENVKPEYAVISAGIKNRYRHPNPEVLHRLENLQTNILRTDKSGAIILKSDGEKVSHVEWK